MMKILVNLMSGLFLAMGLIVGTAQAEQGDPMTSLFKFQKQMAANGSTAAMMKLAELYEQGQGTRQDYAKAMEMYKKAGLNGDARAEVAIKRLEKRKIASSLAARKAEEEKKRQLAKQEALKEKQARDKKLAEEKAARNKARRAELEKQRKEQAARKRATAEKQRQAERDKKQRADEQRRNEADKVRIVKARKDLLAKSKVKEQSSSVETEKEGFKSDPCRGAASRLLSMCSGK